MPYLRQAANFVIKLTVTAKGQVTLRKEVLEHLGVQPGGKIAVEMFPEGRVVISAERGGEPISAMFNLLKKPGQPTLTIEAIANLASDTWHNKK
ncbi:hypothetical protein AX768_30185 (plasmid) [Burkholderia sp. PAMC 28687]|nr:hypothetical protein AX768_30185 [Burkholderia sp. PAMC 28687]